jgi:RHS repeat-associated protein
VGPRSAARGGGGGARPPRDPELCNVSNAVCVSTITRFVWAGDQLLWELRAPGAEDQNLEATTGSGERFGRVSYTHGGGLDRPLALHKEGYQSILPHENWRGQFADGTCVGSGADCGTVSWPGWQTNAYHFKTAPPQSENWRGGLVDGMRDATGQMYKRNRYYDPETGQFTQPDPIGIAGGLNVYGFGSGDPISYDDPYGLCAFGIGRDAGLCSETDDKHTAGLTDNAPECPCVAWFLRLAPAAVRALPLATAATVASSRILRANMAARGILARPGQGAHHIVAGGMRRAQAARDVLARFQININDASNGVYLPTSRIGAAASGSTNHRVLHTNRYLDAVNELLSGATTREEALATLRYIATQLQQHTFPY